MGPPMGHPHGTPPWDSPRGPPQQTIPNKLSRPVPGPSIFYTRTFYEPPQVILSRPLNMWRVIYEWLRVAKVKIMSDFMSEKKTAAVPLKTIMSELVMECSRHGSHKKLWVSGVIQKKHRIQYLLFQKVSHVSQTCALGFVIHQGAWWLM